MLERRVQDSRARAVRHVARTLRQQRDQLATLGGVAENLELDLRVAPRDVVELVTDTAGLVPRTPDRESIERLELGLLADRLPLVVAHEVDFDAPVPESGRTAMSEDDLRTDPVRGLLNIQQLEPSLFAAMTSAGPWTTYISSFSFCGPPATAVIGGVAGGPRGQSRTRP